MIFNAHTLAKGWRSVAIASGSDKHQPALDHAVFIEQYSTGVRLVATDSTVLLHTWCPTAAAEEEDLYTPPAWDDAPLATAVALDPHGRAKGFLAHAQQLAGDDNAGMIEISLDLGVIVEEHEPRPPRRRTRPRRPVPGARRRHRRRGPQGPRPPGSTYMTVTVTDLFCGAGGSSTGAAAAGAEIVMAANHWATAIDVLARHYTDGAPLCHAVVDRDGTVHQIVPDRENADV